MSLSIVAEERTPQGPQKESRRDRRSKKLVASDIRWTRETPARQGLACFTTPREWLHQLHIAADA